jgi:predicted O-methyltransferase YrrM
MPQHLPWREVAPGDGPLIPTSVLTEEAAELAKLARGKRVLELGAAFGYSAITMALGGAEHIDTVDSFISFESTRQELEKNLAAYRVSGVVTIHEMDTAELPGGFAAGSFGLIFIDAGHSYDDVKRDIGLSMPLLKPGGYLAVHDYDEDCNPRVRVAVDEAFPEGPLRIVGTLFIIQKA